MFKTQRIINGIRVADSREHDIDIKDAEFFMEAITRILHNYYDDLHDCCGCAWEDFDRPQILRACYGCCGEANVDILYYNNDDIKFIKDIENTIFNSVANFHPYGNININSYILSSEY